jgi:beta-propeller repeat-containing protein
LSPRSICAPAFIILLLLAQAFPLGRATSQTPSVVWGRTWGGAGTEFSSCLQRDSSGNLYTAGPTNSFAAGVYQTFILKYDSIGNLLWQKTYGTPNTDDIANPCGMDSSNNLYIAGYTQPAGNDCAAWPSYGLCSVFLLKLDSLGNILWQKDWGGNASNVPHGIIVDPSGYVYVSGFFETSGIGGGIPNAFLLKFNSTGSLLWQKSWGGLRGDNGNGLGTDSLGNVYLTGYTKTFGDGSGELFVLKISPIGNILWERAWGLSGFDEGFWVTTDGSNNVFVTGRTGSFKTGAGSDVVVLKYNSTGDLQWQRVWGSNASSVGDGIGGELVLDNSGNIFIAGVVGSSTFDPSTLDVLILEFDSQGELLHQNAFGAVGYDGPGGQKLGDAGSLYISGHVSEAPPYNGTALNFTSFSPVLGSGAPTIPLQSLAYQVTTMAGSVTTASGTSSYGGGMDALLLKCTLTCGNGTVSRQPTPSTQLAVFQIVLIGLTLSPTVAVILRTSRNRRNRWELRNNQSCP